MKPKGRSELIMETSAVKENGNVMKESEYKHTRCTNHYEDMFKREAQRDEGTEDDVKSIENVEVDIMNHVNSGDIGLLEAELQNSTDNSSSFGGSLSGVSSGAPNSDAEVESGLHGDATSSQISKKRLASHWRTFIQPLMWRCKWVELQMERFQSQAVKYDQELAQYEQKMLFGLEHSMVEDCGAKSVPLSSQIPRKNILKRKKRKRVEDTMDLASYMSHHNLFSYYGSKKPGGAGALINGEWISPVIRAEKITCGGNDEFGVIDELLPLELSDGDNFLEQILQKIGVVQSQVTNLRDRLDKVLGDKARNFHGNDVLSMLVPCNAWTSSARNPTSPPPTDSMPVRRSYIASQLVSEYNKGDLVLPESAAVSSLHGKVSHLRTGHSQVASASCKNTGDGMLIYSRRPKEEFVNLAEMKPRAEDKEESRIPLVIPAAAVVPEPDPNDQPAPKIRSLSKLTEPTNKRKRGRRKPSSSRWSKRSSG